MRFSLALEAREKRPRVGTRLNKQKKTESNNCFIIHCFEKNNYKQTDLCFYGGSNDASRQVPCRVPVGRFPRPSRSIHFGDVSVANGRETPNSVCSDHVTRNASAARKNEAKGRR